MSIYPKRQMEDFIHIFLSNGAQWSDFCRRKGPGTAVSFRGGRRRCGRRCGRHSWQGCTSSLRSHQWARFPMGQQPGAPHQWNTRSSRTHNSSWPSVHKHSQHMLSLVWEGLGLQASWGLPTRAPWLRHPQGQAQQEFCLCFKKSHKSLFNMHLGMIYHLLTGLMASCALGFRASHPA